MKHHGINHVAAGAAVAVMLGTSALAGLGTANADAAAGQDPRVSFPRVNFPQAHAPMLRTPRLWSPLIRWTTEPAGRDPMIHMEFRRGHILFPSAVSVRG